MSDQYLPCTRCGAATDYATMSALGARCRLCFDAYCVERPEKSTRTPQARLPGFRPRPALRGELPMEAVGDVLELPETHRAPMVEDYLSERAFALEGLD